MPLDIVRYRRSGEVGWGVLSSHRITPIEGRFESTREFMLDGAARAWAQTSDSAESFGADQAEILCPITTDQQVLCQAINYHSHMRESGFDPRSNPFNIFFRKASSCLAHADSEIVCPEHVEFLDYEVELGLVLCRDVSGPLRVTENDLHEFVGGLVILNDVSARDVQLPELQFYKGKSYRTFGPTGPHLTLVDREDLARFDALRLRLSVNGEERQNALTTDMVHRPPATLSELSTFQDWRAGDLIATGTPGGCALRAPAKPLQLLANVVSPARRQALLRKVAASNPRRLRVGDQIEASIRTDDGVLDLGRQRNAVVSATR
jgi:2-keto-4-pentenoate hydratase/2-oxohepta-3-ene-1,7-dioic acid hydratase in catechol pathway